MLISRLVNLTKPHLKHFYKETLMTNLIKLTITRRQLREQNYLNKF